ncbi:MAG: hypothetical protein J6T84_01445 [Spirochaetaceae bacterium]|nr:hypothetical protein [Spirochaetaceae bacterium]
MTLYEIASLITPPVFMKILHKCFKNENSERYRKKLLEKNISTIGQLPKQSEKLIVMGNGPSLTKSIEKYNKEIIKYDCIVVNYFCESEYYKELKPKYYLLADPVFFGKLETYVDWQRNKIMGFIKSLILTTTWDINLIVPNFAIGSRFIEEIKKNSFIHLYYYIPYDLVQYNDNNKFLLWDKNLIAPPSHNCLNTCVWMGIFFRYRETYIIGADSNWLERIHINQETNELYITDSYFYGSKINKEYKNSSETIPSSLTLAEELLNESIAFNNYSELNNYADYAGVKVYNASEYSLIDTFERKKF